MRRLLIGVAIVAVLTLVVVAAGSTEPSPAPISAPSSAASTPDVEDAMGAYLDEHEEVVKLACDQLDLIGRDAAEDAFSAGYGAPSNGVSADEAFALVLERC